MLWPLLFGFVLGVVAVLFLLYVFICDPFGPKVTDASFIDQFKPIQIPDELRRFLKTGEDGQGVSQWESTLSLTLFLHMFYQEHKDTRQLRRWFHKRLQLELNDITTRSAAGRLIQDIRIRDLCLGTKFPTIRRIRVEKVDMSEDKDTFESITFLIEMDYAGGFETSIDVQALLGGYGSLSIKVTRLSGYVRLILSRKPYNHWTFSFVAPPQFEFDISSQIQGHRLKHVIPLIAQQIRRAVQRKHVWPNYKIRYRPIFPNPLLQPSPPHSSFAHVKLVGGLEVTVLQCSRLKTGLVDVSVAHEVYCTVTLDQRPFLHSSDSSVSHSISVLLTFSRFDVAGDSGLTFLRYAKAHGNAAVRVAAVEVGSLADKANFKAGDTVVAINSIPVRNERQVESLLKMKGDLLVLVERDLDEIDDQELKDGEVLIGDVGGHPDDAFVCVGELNGKGQGVARPDHLPMHGSVQMRDRSNSASSDSVRRHSMSVLPASSTSAPAHSPSPSQSIGSSLADLNQMAVGALERRPPGSACVSRTESARVPQVLVSVPSIDLRRTRSESQLDVKPLIETKHLEMGAGPCDASFTDEEDIFACVAASSLGRAPIPFTEDIDHLGVADDESDKRSTLKAGQTAANLIAGGSQASLASSASMNSNVVDGCADEDGEAKLSRSRPASTRRARIHTALAAGKRRVFDLIPQKRRSNEAQPVDSVELGTEAGEHAMEDGSESSRNRSPVPPCGKRSPTECVVTDQVEKEEGKQGKDKERSKGKRLGRKKKGLSPCTPRKAGVSASASPQEDSPSGSSVGFVHSRSTRPVFLQPNVLWGQSLHFELDGDRVPSKRYLNVTVHARESTRGADAQSEERKEPGKPVLLGYTSLYIPQLIDDCRLTLSNCHREVFHLKPPTGVHAAELPGAAPSFEFARHPGFDPRLLFGDVTLNLRYFPDGLPHGAGASLGDSSDEEHRTSSTTATESLRPVTPAGFTSSQHDWKPWSAKQSAVCAMCRGKIWLKSGLCCTRCLVVCHVKCQMRANSGIVCSPSPISQNDDKFEDITSEEQPFVSHVVDTLDGESDSLATISPLGGSSVIPPIEADKIPYKAETEAVSRRSRFKTRMSEKIGQLPWRRRKERADDESVGGSLGSLASSFATSDGAASSPVASIASCLSDILPQLEGSPFIANVYFQPGNAYNEETIGNAKKLGKEIFRALPTKERQRKINEQIDKIQQAIRETKDGRLEAMQRERRESEGEERRGRQSNSDSRDFEGLDERLQALAVLMLHYCAALQDCCEQEDLEEQEALRQRQESEGGGHEGSQGTSNDNEDTLCFPNAVEEDLFGANSV